MRLLLDTHTLIWALDQPANLSASAATALRNPVNDLLSSAATVWEISIKVGNGKLKLASSYLQWMNQAVTDLNLAVLPITPTYADVQSTLPRHHGDPFDRMLIAQAIADSIAIVSADATFDAYGVTRLW